MASNSESNSSTLGGSPELPTTRSFRRGPPGRRQNESARQSAIEFVRSSVHIDDVGFQQLPKNPRLDPTSSDFNAGEWMTALMELMEEGPETYNRQSAGLSFQYLYVHGSANPDFRPDRINQPFQSNDERLDPTSAEFSISEWMKAQMELSDREPDKYPRHSAGVSFRHLYVDGSANLDSRQHNVLNAIYRAPLALGSKIRGLHTRPRILNDFNGLVQAGEMVLVLGRPGSGVSTLLKTMAGETKGLEIEAQSTVNYQGISMDAMHKYFRGETIYQAEEDVHFPHLTVNQTLQFAALMRTPRNRFQGVSPQMYAQNLRDVVMEMYGISHTANTQVGNDFIRGVSGGERKRVSIAEATLNQSVVQCWDNSTRGLDSATAVDFTRTLRQSSDLTKASMFVAMYQASQASYELFDKVTVLYEGYQIYFGPTQLAKQYFVDMGYYCPDRQTTTDFLTSVTNPAERRARAGFENMVPRTPQEFVLAWEKSELYEALQREIDLFEKANPLNGKQVDNFLRVRDARQSVLMRTKSPYTISVPRQIWLCMVRGYHRLRHDWVFLCLTAAQNTAIGFVLGSAFYNMPITAESVASRTTLLFFAVLFNSLSGAFEIIPLYGARPIVSKHVRYALYHPFAESVSSMICDLPNKFISCIVLNSPLYLLSNLRREPGPFFTFLLFGFSSTLVLSMVLRLLGHLSRNVYQALAPYAFIVIGMIIYTGYVLPTRMMRDWLRWVNYVNPIAYAYESLVVNELSGRVFHCAQFVPPYPNTPRKSRACSAPGAAPGSDVINGDNYIESQLAYDPSHLWRNFGIIVGFTLAFMIIYLLAVEFIDPDRTMSQNLVYVTENRCCLRRLRKTDEETGSASTEQHELSSHVEHDKATSERSVAMEYLAHSKRVFHWSNLCYDITVKRQPRRILNDVSGWVKPGSLTALMGSTGAGKTTLLDVLADRISVGVVSGDVSINGIPRSKSFQRETGYVKQQDIHLPSSTVREALRFSAVLRQPGDTSKKEKYAYVEEIIVALEMERYADAVVGEVGSRGLSVEQRKRLTIGVELAAKPDLLLFLDEPTSGLDSQSAWSIGALVRKLADNGQAILCTIHQPSALLFQQFDRLLLLAKGGKMVYFGDIGKDSRTMIEYFERNGAHTCEAHENPAEWMLEVTGSGTGPASKIDWSQTWIDSSERADMLSELQKLGQELAEVEENTPNYGHGDYATSFWTQFTVALGRSFQQYWRTPSYIYAKLLLSAGTTLIVGLSFQDATLSMQGVQNQMFATFMIQTALVFLAYQTMPQFIAQRDVFEARESASRTYSWYVFMLVNIIVELPWTAISAVMMFITWYYPIGMNNNAAGATCERGFLVFLLLWGFMVFASTYTDMIIAAVDSAELGALLSLTLFIICLVFCGVIVPKSELPDFWTFMYHTSPFTYLVGAILSTGLAHRNVTCSPLELLRFESPPEVPCGDYMSRYMQVAGGHLINPQATGMCGFCPVATTDEYLSAIDISYDDRWRNFGLLWIYIAFNIVAALGLYWLARVPKRWNKLQIRK